MLINYLSAFIFSVTSIYSLTVNTINMGQVQLSAYQGKKILLVNIATQSGRARQILELDQLCKQYKDSLVVLAFPSDSFGDEVSTTTEDLQLALLNGYNVSYPIVDLSVVKGSGIHAVYNWLSDSTQNGVMNAIVNEDFHKILIDGGGTIRAVFAGELSPMDSIVQNAVMRSY